MSIMACNVLSRLFRRRDRQEPVSDHMTGSRPPALPPAHSTDKLQLEQSLVQLELVQNQEHDNIFLLSCLPEQEPCTLTLANIPFGTDNTHIQSLRSLPGFIAFEGEALDTPSTGTDVLIHFSTAADAIQAMASHPTITLGSGSSRRLQHDSRITDTSERAVKRQKTEPSEPLPKCLICCEELPGPHSRPCLHCDARWCYPCLKINFSTALNDQERFPVKCCGRIVHFDVGKGFLATDDYSKYKIRFEETCTTKPVYCANPKCSEFLPARLSEPDDKGRVQCFCCQEVTCVACRVLVYPEQDETHKCTEADEMTALMTQFDYKRCPRCNTGVAKMYGCSHVRCGCGAHWCWDCQRAIQICWSKPCERAREDGDMTDDYDMHAEESDTDDEPAASQAQLPPSMGITTTEVSNPEITQPVESLVVGETEGVPVVAVAEQAGVEGEQVHEAPLQSQQPDPSITPVHVEEASPQSQEALTSADTHVTPVTADENTITPAPPLDYRPPAALSTTPPITVAQPAAITEPPINLDGDDQDDWEAGDFDFGDEPIDETWDTWGCLHHLEIIESSKMHQYWLPAFKDPQSQKPIKHVDCLRCYKTITITEPVAEPKKDEEKKDGERKDSGVHVSAEAWAALVTDAEVPEIKIKKKKRKNRKSVEAEKIFNCRRCGVVYCIACKKIVMKELKTIRGAF